MSKTLIRRRQRDQEELSFNIEITRTRHFYFDLPEGLPFDDRDVNTIEAELWEMEPSPETIQLPVPDGCGGLVSTTFFVSVEGHEEVEDLEICANIQDAVRAGLKNRAWVVNPKIDGVAKRSGR